MIAGHAVEVLAGDDGPHVDLGAAVGRADLQPAGALAEPLDQGVGDLADGHGHAAGHAPLAGAAEGRELQAPTAWSRSASGMTIRWFFAPPAAWTRLPLLRAGLIDVPGHRGRADERDGADQGMRQERIDGTRGRRARC